VDTKGGSYGKSNRIEALDALRGVSILFVVFYHLIYDLIYYKGFNIPFFYSKAFGIVHSVFLAVLFLVSGCCASFSRDVIKRGAILAVLGEAITVATAIFSPENLIVFGVLSFFGISMILYGLISPALQKIPWAIVLVTAAALWFALRDFGSGRINLIFTELHFNLPRNRDYLYPFGITSPTFRSADYFPLIPTFFIFLFGTALSKPIKSNQFPKSFYTLKAPVISFIGRHSLLIYLVHQPLLLFILLYI